MADVCVFVSGPRWHGHTKDEERLVRIKLAPGWVRLVHSLFVNETTGPLHVRRRGLLTNSEVQVVLLLGRRPGSGTTRGYGPGQAVTS